MSNQVQSVWSAGGGTFYAFDYASDLKAISDALILINGNLTTLNGFLNTNMSIAASGTARTPAAAWLVQASALNMLADIMSVNMQTSTETNGAVSSLNTSLAAIAASLSDIGASANVQLAMNIEKNEFEMQATNQARQEAGLPKVEVQQKSIQDRIKNTATTAITVQSMTTTSGLVQAGVNRATTFAGNLVSEYVTAPVGGYITSAATTVKGWFVTAKPAEKTKQEIVQGKVDTNNGLLAGGG